VTSTIRAAIRVEGVVQGVGFRPFVYALATRLGLAGWVGNDVDGVFAEVEGSAEAVGDFLASVQRDAPPLARVERVTARPIDPDGASGFAIVPSDPTGHRRTLISADCATCPDCLRELADPADRRFGYPFINCTNCGPRFTIVRDVPYDRPLTTMAGFAMCARCAAEYQDPADRRFHAQPVCCPACGPRLRLVGPAGTERADPGRDGPGPAGAALAGAVAALRRGQIVAVKGLGGYHLAVDATSQQAAARLRSRKHREDKPFAVMVPDLAAARGLCELDDLAGRLLASSRRPIVLLPRRPAPQAGSPPVAEAVAPGNRQLGLLLPYTPLHHLLLHALARPMVLTSGNVSDEPIAYRDEDARQRLGGIADVFLTHDRPIHIRTDDSVIRTFRGREAVLRRSRGYVPEPLRLGHRFRRPVLGCGAELKNTFCLGREDRAFLSHHIGDLENYETLRSFTEGIAHFRRLFDITPQLIAHDLHPDYLSTKYALDLAGDELAGGELAGAELVGVQHHHAHIASCLADNEADGPVVGVAFDGTGYGTDGTIWGGEFLLADLAGFERAGHLAGVPMPGGAAAIRQPWRMAAAYLAAAFPEGLPGGPGDGPGDDPRAGRGDDPRAGPAGGLAVMARNRAAWPGVLAMAGRGVNSPVTSSAGRLFDAVAALLGVRDSINYEGQAAIELEQLAATAPAARHPGSGGGRPGGRGGGGIRPDAYQARITGGSPLIVTGPDLVRAAAEDLLDGAPSAVVSARFQHGVAAMIGQVCLRLREVSGLGTVALSGGVFQNLPLLEAVVALLEGHGFRVLTHSRVPPNDGGISLGQAVVAGARDRASLLP
jgi:hydrogenase maturation protein HypF